MKYITFITALLVATAGRGQTVLRVDSIPQSVSVFENGIGFVLDKAWKWHAGDNPAWAAIDYNDSAWQPIDPTLDVVHSLPQIPKAGILWLRLRFTVSSRIQERQLALLVQQSGASEIFYNGRPLKKLGLLASEGNRTRAFDPSFEPILLPGDSLQLKVIALRYALQEGVHYTTAFGASTNPLFTVKLQYAEPAVTNFRRWKVVFTAYQLFVGGIFFLLALIHFGFYFFRKEQKANLYFALYAVCYVLFVLFQILNSTNYVDARYYSLTAGFFFVDIIGPVLLTAIYELLGFRRDIVYKSIIVIFLVSLVFYWWQYDWGWRFGTDVMTFLVQFAIVRIVVRAMLQKKKGARLLAAGAIVFLLSFLLFISSQIFFPQYMVLVNSYFVVGVLSIPLATSLYLGLESGFLNVYLREKLDEVSQLSEKNVQQEKEKQQILSAQNETLERQVKERTAALSQSIEELKTTQAQLIQAEKMASLGELTAGIAHEIQNPLNFVNNFSEVSAELIDEMQEAINQNDTQTAKEIAGDVRANLEKIEFHGKRADAIVKGMLQHSRTAATAKEPTDINKLADEYLRLAYHGLRAKEKDFSANYETAFAPDMPTVKVVPQEIGRVLLNLFNNAFYSVNQKKKSAGAAFTPLVAVTTWFENNHCCVRVADNGMGIPAAIRDKIFQPFFTTKPTGQGTGLGLSISYDIIKAHGGRFELTSKEDEMAAFIIKLPVE